MTVKAGGGELGVVLLAGPVGLAPVSRAPGAARGPAQSIPRVRRLPPHAGLVPPPTPGPPR